MGANGAKGKCGRARKGRREKARKREKGAVKRHAERENRAGKSLPDRVGRAERKGIFKKRKSLSFSAKAAKKRQISAEKIKKTPKKYLTYLDPYGIVYKLCNRVEA